MGHDRLLSETGTVYRGNVGLAQSSIVQSNAGSWQLRPPVTSPHDILGSTPLLGTRPAPDKRINRRSKCGGRGPRTSQARTTRWVVRQRYRKSTVSWHPSHGHRTTCQCLDRLHAAPSGKRNTPIQCGNLRWCLIDYARALSPV